MLDELAAFMDKHQFQTVDDFKGHSLQYLHDPPRPGRAASNRPGSRPARQTRTQRKMPIEADHEWRGDDFVKQTDALSRG